MLGSPILYLKGMRIMMFQLSGFYCRLTSSLQAVRLWVEGSGAYLGFVISQGSWFRF